MTVRWSPTTKSPSSSFADRGIHTVHVQPPDRRCGRAVAVIRQVCENHPAEPACRPYLRRPFIMRRVSTVLIPAFVLSCLAVMTVSAGAQNPGGSPEGKKMKNPVASSPESIKAGQALFQKN